MKDSIYKRCELFVSNRDDIKYAFRWESAYFHPMCAMMFASKNLMADVERMKQCHELLKRQTRLFSNFRGTSKMATVSMLSLSSNPEESMSRMLMIYDKLKEEFRGSEYLAFTAAVLSEIADPKAYDSICRRAREIYSRMKEAHPFLTSSEDSTFAALLAMSELDDVHIAQEMERCYQILKPSFFSGNAVQSLSHVLALGEDPAEQKCNKVMDLFNYLKERGYNYSTGYELATLGVFALLDTDIGILAKDIMDVDDYLKTRKGFGAFGIGVKQRLMYSGMLALSDYTPDNYQTVQIAAVNSVVSLVIAEQAALCASMAAAGAAAAAASASSD